MISTNYIPKSHREELRNHYHKTIFDDIVSWWGKYSIDKEKGGYLTRLERDGTPSSYDKNMWMTAREIWMLSHLYNNYKPEQRWRDYAKHGPDFMLKHAFKENGKMHFRLDRNGRSRASSLSLYTEVFASIAIAEYWKIEPSDTLNKKQKNV